MTCIIYPVAVHHAKHCLLPTSRIKQIEIYLFDCQWQQEHSHLKLNEHAKFAIRACNKNTAYLASERAFFFPQINKNHFFFTEHCRIYLVRLRTRLLANWDFNDGALN